jgi:uncharacterized membrane protein
MLRQPFAVPALLILALSIPLILGLVPRNRLGYGIRTPKTIADDSDWYRANRFGGWALLLSSIVYLVVMALAPSPPPPNDSLLVWLLHLGAFVGPLAVSLVLIRGYIKRL